MRQRWDKHMDLPSDVHSTDEVRANVALAITLGVVIAGLALAHLFLASIVTPFSAFMVMAQP